MLAAAGMGSPTPADSRARRWAGEGRTCPPVSQQERQGGQRTTPHPVPRRPRCGHRGSPALPRPRSGELQVLLPGRRRPLPALRAPLPRAHDGPAARVQTQLREPRSLTLCTAHSSHSASLRCCVFSVVLLVPSGLCVKACVCGRACTCAGVPTCGKSWTDAQSWPSCFPRGGRGACLFVAVCG